MKMRPARPGYIMNVSSACEREGGGAEDKEQRAEEGGEEHAAWE